MKKVLIIGLFILFSSIVLLNNLQTTVYAFDELDICTTENRILVDIIDKTLGDGFYSYQYLYDLDDNGRFILVEGDNKYLIYDTEINDYIEYSNMCNSPYSELSSESKKIYISPTIYLEEVEGNIYDVANDEIISNEKIIEYKNVLKAISPTYCEKLYLYSADGIISESTETNMINSDYSPVYIANSSYFENLNENLGNNEGIYDSYSIKTLKK